MHHLSAPACQAVFLDAGTLPCGQPFDQHLDAALPSRLVYQAHERTAPVEVAARIAQAELVVTNKMRLSAELLAPGIPNLLLTPQVAWASEQVQQRLAARLAEQVAQHLRERGMHVPANQPGAA